MIFVDTGAWFAVAVWNDPDHEALCDGSGVNREPLITTDYVLAETATLIRMRDKTARGHRLAVRVASSILRQQTAILQNVTTAEGMANGARQSLAPLTYCVQEASCNAGGIETVVPPKFTRIQT